MDEEVSGAPFLYPNDSFMTPKMTRLCLRYFLNSVFVCFLLGFCLLNNAGIHFVNHIISGWNKILSFKPLCLFRYSIYFTVSKNKTINICINIHIFYFSINLHKCCFTCRGFNVVAPSDATRGRQRCLHAVCGYLSWYGGILRIKRGFLFKF